MSAYTVVAYGEVVRETDNIHIAARSHKIWLDDEPTRAVKVLNSRGIDVTAAVLQYVNSFPEGTK